MPSDVVSDAVTKVKRALAELEAAAGAEVDRAERPVETETFKNVRVDARGDTLAIGFDVKLPGGESVRVGLGVLGLIGQAPDVGERAIPRHE